MRLATRLCFPAPCSALALLLILLSLAITCANLIDPRTTLVCHLRHYQFRVDKPDIVDPETGSVLRCSGMVTVNSCWGRCDSSEVCITAYGSNAIFCFAMSI
ncbi:glycoprotein hormone beta-5-like [Plakobranchus ocellatus]|uniref:Glycoprotein hormone beta-5-like n=1 Tax=Plakobranchus ocellatus TaxID=259542 RepID=A0AAV4B7U6_9GAST|nr:glycoprotein hormone beta-5-like [Plakobranchus ocellatus]